MNVTCHGIVPTVSCLYIICVVVLQALNQVVLWDKIVMREGNQEIDLKSVDPEYYFFDDGRGLL